MTSDNSKLFGRKTTGVSALRGTAGYNTMSSVMTEPGSQSRVDEKEWLDEHKLIVFCIVAITVIFFVIIILCCRYCGKKGKKQSKGKAHAGHATSVAHEYFEIPPMQKSRVQPKKRGQTIRELGKLEFSLEYEYKRSQLNVNVIRGEDFPLLSSSNVSFTYVVVELLPFSLKYEAKPQTHYVRNNVSPVFNDVINYHIQAKDLDVQTLCLSIFDINHLSAHDLIGSVKLEFVGKKIESGLKMFFKKNLEWEKNLESSRHIGEILVGLCWKSEEEVLELAIQEASDLRIMDTVKQTSNPYVKVQVYVNTFLILKKRTKVKRRNISPKFKKKFDVNIPCECLAQNSQIVITVKHVGMFRKKQVIGQLCLAGNDAKETVAEHWKVMRRSAGRYVEMWHELDLSVDISLLESESKMKCLLFGDSDDDTSAESSDARSCYEESFEGPFDYERNL